MVKKIIGIVLVAIALIGVVGHAITGTFNEVVSSGELLGGYIVFLIVGIVLIILSSGKGNKQ